MTPTQKLLFAIDVVVRDSDKPFEEKVAEIRSIASEDELSSLQEFLSWFDPDDDSW